MDLPAPDGPIRLPLVQLFLYERVERVLGADLGGRSRTGVGVVDEQVHRLIGPLFGRQRIELVLHREVFGGGQPEADFEVVQRIADIDGDVEIHRARILPVRGDAGPDGFDRRNVEGRVGDVSDPVYIAIRRDLEYLLGDHGRIVAHRPARKDVFA